jgi:hypothetical protein
MMSNLFAILHSAVVLMLTSLMVLGRHVGESRSTTAKDNSAQEIHFNIAQYFAELTNLQRSKLIHLSKEVSGVNQSLNESPIS